MVVEPGDDIMVISSEGIMIRVPIEEISQQGRATQGVTIMKLDGEDKVVAVARVATKDDDKE
jgi:DNA gyrase subunit A